MQRHTFIFHFHIPYHVLVCWFADAWAPVGNAVCYLAYQLQGLFCWDRKLQGEDI